MRWYGVYVSYPGWNERSPESFATEAEADQWWKGKVAMAMSPKDWGYSYPADDAGNPIREVEAFAQQNRVPTNPATLAAIGKPV